MMKQVEKREEKLSIKWMIVTFLAISKIFSWMEKIAEFSQSDSGSLHTLIFERLLVRDLPLIIGVVGYFILDRFKLNEWLKASILYVILLILLPLLGFPLDFSLLINFTVVYVIINGVLILKERKKSKEES